MLVPLPNLDDRRWADLVEEGRALIPVYDQGWSDHNIHDPGIMLVELLAWLAEMDVYWLNRVPESRLRTFLALAGYVPAGPQSAYAVLEVLFDGDAPLLLPAGMVFNGTNALQQAVPFRSTHAVMLAPGALAAIMRQDDQQVLDLTARYARGETLALFGDDPQPGAIFYLGFMHALPADEPVSLHVLLAGPCSADDARQQLVEWQAQRAQQCQSPDDLRACLPEHGSSSGQTSASAAPLQHHSARVQWEYFDTSKRWQPLPAWDDTRALTLSGRVLLRVPGAMQAMPLGQSRKNLFYLRCRLTAGAFDAPPAVASIAFNGIAMEQAANIAAQRWIIAPGAQVEGSAPQPGAPVGFRAAFNAAGWITELSFRPNEAPGAPLLAYRPPQDGQPGLFSVQAEALKPGDDRPASMRMLEHAPVVAERMTLHTWETSRWVAWQVVADFRASTRADSHVVLDATAGELRFGDGEHGRVLPRGALPLVQYQSTDAAGGNLPAGAIQELADAPANRALVSNLPSLMQQIASIRNRLPAAGGTPAETVAATSARALRDLGHPQRAVTLADIEALARETPGVCLARVAAMPNLHPAYPCMQAPGLVTLLVLPWLPAAQPQPSRGLIQAVQAYVAARRVIGTRIIVAGPRYTLVAVQAEVQACAGVDRAALQSQIIAALAQFFHPLQGGPDGGGWPFGRDVYRTEVLQVIDEIPGVDYVRSLALLDEHGAQCGNLCVGPLGLVAAADHQIEVLRYDS